MLETIEMLPVYNLHPNANFRYSSINKTVSLVLILSLLASTKSPYLDIQTIHNDHFNFIIFDFDFMFKILMHYSLIALIFDNSGHDFLHVWAKQTKIMQTGFTEWNRWKGSFTARD